MLIAGTIRERIAKRLLIGYDVDRRALFRACEMFSDRRQIATALLTSEKVINDSGTAPRQRPKLPRCQLADVRLHRAHPDARWETKVSDTPRQKIGDGLRGARDEACRYVKSGS